MIQDEGRKVFRASTSTPRRVKFALVVLDRNGNDVEHDFEMPGRLSAGALLWLSQFAPDEKGFSTADAFAIMGFFQRTMPKAEFDRFEQVVNDPESSVELQALAEVLDYVVQETTGRPTERLASSTPGQPPTGLMWTPPPSSPAVTSSPSLRPAT